MTNDDLMQFTVVLATKMVTFWDTDLDELALFSWFEAINLACPNATVDDFSVGLMKWVAGPKGEYKPKPASIIALMPNSAASLAGKAWQAAELTVRTAGRNRSIMFDDPALIATIQEMGGWVAFCGLLDKPESVDYVRRDFLQIYHSKSLEKNDVALLAGGHQMTNAERFALKPSSMVKVECTYIHQSNVKQIEHARI